MKENEQKNHIQMYSGLELKSLPEYLKQRFSQQVSDLLALHKATMLQFEPLEIAKILNESRAVVATEQGEVCAFIQIFPWTQSGSVDVLELRSWLSIRQQAGLGVLKAALELCAEQFKGIPVYGSVAYDNIHAQEKLLSVGGKEVPMPESMGFVLKDQDGFTPVKVFFLKGGETYDRA
jgi:hypothetical protein